MQGIACGPLRVTQEAVVADERQTGFQSKRKIMIEHCVRVIVPFRGVIQHDWPFAGNSGRCLTSGLVLMCDRANPAFTGGRVP